MQVLLGSMYANGDGLAKDAAQASNWYRLAAYQGDSDAQQLLGAMYVDGYGVQKDIVIAHMWLNISSVSGNQSAKEIRDFIETRMTPDQISDATQRANACISSNYSNCN